jgi:hypothetical protein
MDAICSPKRRLQLQSHGRVPQELNLQRERHLEWGRVIECRVGLLERAEIAWELAGNCCGSGTGTVQEPCEGKSLSLETVIRVLVKTQQPEKEVRPVVDCRVCTLTNCYL